MVRSMHALSMLWFGTALLWWSAAAVDVVRDGAAARDRAGLVIRSVARAKDGVKIKLGPTGATIISGDVSYLVTQTFARNQARREAESGPRGRRTEAARARKDANDVMRKVYSKFSASSVHIQQVTTTEWDMTWRFVPDGSGSVGVIIDVKDSPPIDRRYGVDQLLIGGLSLVRRELIYGLPGLSNIGKPGRFAYLVRVFNGRIEVATAPPVGMPKPIYRPRGQSSNAPPRVPLKLLGLSVYEGTNVAQSESVFQIQGQIAKYSSWRYSMLWQRSTHPQDIAYAKALVNRIKRPYDPLEVYFFTNQGNMTYEQTVVAVDKNGYLGVIFNVAVDPSLELSKDESKGYLQLRFFDDRGAGLITFGEVKLPENAPLQSNVGKMGTYVYTISQDGKLLGRRGKSSVPYLFRPCRGREKPNIANIDYNGSPIPGGPFRSGKLTYRNFKSLGILTDIVGVNPEDVNIDFQVSSDAIGTLYPYSYCELSLPTGRRALSRAQNSVRRAGAKQFVATRGFAGSFVVNRPRISYLGEVIYLQGKDGTIAGVLNMPSAVRAPMGLQSDRSEYRSYERIYFCSADTNAGTPGRHVFVTKKDDPREESLFRIAPKKTGGCRKVL